MNLNEMSVTELKALAYDYLGIIENAQRNIQLINQAIAEKSKPAPEEEPKAEETDTGK